MAIRIPFQAQIGKPSRSAAERSARDRPRAAESPCAPRTDTEPMAGAKISTCASRPASNAGTPASASTATPRDLHHTATWYPIIIYTPFPRVFPLAPGTWEFRPRQPGTRKTVQSQQSAAVSRTVEIAFDAVRPLPMARNAASLPRCGEPQFHGSRIVAPQAHTCEPA